MFNKLAYLRDELREKLNRANASKEIANVNPHDVFLVEIESKSLSPHQLAE